MKRILTATLLGALLSLGISACASMGAKDRAIYTHQSTQTHLEVVQDTERRLCNPAAFEADPSAPILECTGPVAAGIGLTTEKHRAFAGHMRNAYAAQIRLGSILMLWKPGAPVPVELTTLESQVTSALA